MKRNHNVVLGKRIIPSIATMVVITSFKKDNDLVASELDIQKKKKNQLEEIKTTSRIG
jgi:hypothetical protein